MAESEAAGTPYESVIEDSESEKPMNDSGHNEANGEEHPRAPAPPPLIPDMAGTAPVGFDPEDLRTLVDRMTGVFERVMQEFRRVGQRCESAPYEEASMYRTPSSIPVRSREAVGNGGLRKCMTPKKFTGDETLVWEDYYVRFELISDWNQWTERERSDALLMSLEGDAASHIHGIPGFRTLSYRELCYALADRFGLHRTLAEDKRRFRTRRKRPEETYAHMAQDLSRLAQRIYKGDLRMAEQEAREQFLRGVTALDSSGRSSCEP